MSCKWLADFLSSVIPSVCNTKVSAASISRGESDGCQETPALTPDPQMQLGAGACSHVKGRSFRSVIFGHLGSHMGRFFEGPVLKNYFQLIKRKTLNVDLIYCFMSSSP